MVDFTLFAAKTIGNVLVDVNKNSNAAAEQPQLDASKVG